MDTKGRNCVHIIFILLIAYGFAFKVAKSAKSSKFKLPERFVMENGVGIESEYTQLAKEYKAIDLGLGTPDFLPPIFVRTAIFNVTISDDVSINQYSPASGNLKLRKILASLYSELINHDLHPIENFIVTAGATEALYLTFQAHTSPGDEWIVMEPAHTSYTPMITMAGGIPRYIQLKSTNTRGKVTSADWVYEKNELARLFNKKTKGIVVNTPHNPIGKVFTKAELQFIADLAIKWNTLVVADETYEWLVYKPNKHVRITTLSDMFERTITICSASKTFSVTGWRVGWAYGPVDKINNLKALHPLIIHSAPTPMQVAVALAMKEFLKDFGQPTSYLANYVEELQSKRDEMIDMLEEIGMSPTIPEAGYFVTSNWRALESRTRLDNEADELDDYRFTKWVAKNVGVLGYPLSSFFSEENKQWGESFVRYCFVKKNKTLEKAAKFLLEWIQWGP